MCKSTPHLAGGTPPPPDFIFLGALLQLISRLNERISEEVLEFIRSSHDLFLKRLDQTKCCITNPTR